MADTADSNHEDHISKGTVQCVNETSDERQLIDESPRPHYNSCSRCGGCSVVIEPLLVLFMLLDYPMVLLLPEYAQRRELERLTGQTNLSVHRNTCVPHVNHTLTEDPLIANLSLASSAASYFELEMTLVSTIPCIPVIILLGSFSDKAGRKYAIVPPLVGQVLTLLTCTLTMYFKWPIEIILVGFFINGCSGMWPAFFAGAFSYVADITTKERRSFRMVMARLSMSISIIASTSGSGYLVDWLGYFWVYFSMFVLSLVSLLYALFLVPETKTRDSNLSFFTFSYIKKAFLVFILDDSSKRRWKLMVLFAALFCFLIVATCGTGIDTLFTMNRPLCWGPELVGDYSSVRQAVSVVGCGIIVWAVGARVRDAWFCILAGASATAASVFRFFVVTTSMMFGSAAIEFPNPFFIAMIRSMFSKLVRDDEIGAVMSSVGVFEVTSTLLGHVVSNPIYSVTELAGYPAAVYLYMAGSFLISTIIMGVYTALTRHKMSGHTQD